MRQKLAHSHATGRQGFDLGSCCCRFCRRVGGARGTYRFCHRCWLQRLLLNNDLSHDVVSRTANDIDMVFVVAVVVYETTRRNECRGCFDSPESCSSQCAKVVTIKSRLDLRRRSMKNQKTSTRTRSGPYASIAALNGRVRVFFIMLVQGPIRIDHCSKS